VDDQISRSHLFEDIILFILLETLLDELLNFRCNDCKLTIPGASFEWQILSNTVLSNGVTQYSEPFCDLPLRKPFYCIQFSDKLVLMRYR
jgi:hypothetical protein